jgi:glycosyltransferase involved in cell wall biosynthesis
MGSRGPLVERYAALGLPRVHVPVKSFKRPGAVVQGLRVLRSLRRRRIQILHAHDIYSNIFAVPWARLARTPVVIASRRWQLAVPSRSHVVANRMVSRWATGVLANSEAVAQTLRQEDGISASRINVIPNFVGPEAFEPYPEGAKRQLFARLGIPDGAFVVGVVARLSPAKDHATLLEAVSEPFRKDPGLHLLLVGSGPTEDRLAAQASALGLAGRVHFAGTLPNIPNPHSLLDISVLCSVTEGFPNAVIEAMAAGRPVVATAVGGTPEALDDGQEGLLVPPADVPALRQSLQQLIDSVELRQRFGAAGRARAARVYRADVVIGRLEDWYRTLLGET